MSGKLLRMGVLFLVLGGLAGCEGCEKQQQPQPPVTQLAPSGGSGA